MLVSGASSEPNLGGALLVHSCELTMQTAVRIYGQNVKYTPLPPSRVGPPAAV